MVHRVRVPLGLSLQTGGLWTHLLLKAGGRRIHSKSFPEEAAAVVDNLARRRGTRPRTVKTLGSTIRALFQGQLSDDELEKLIEALAAQGAIAIQDGKVTYTLTD